MRIKQNTNNHSVTKFIVSEY